ncbi:MAG: 5-formyltetrahydrofolate cyclo-ligase, partial [Cyanobacteria bacterium P01_A01_bin.105]
MSLAPQPAVDSPHTPTDSMGPDSMGPDALPDRPRPASASADQGAVKATLRRSLLKARQSIPPQLWQQKSQRICQHLAHWPQFRQAKTILAYCSFRNEPDLGPLLQQQRS